MGISKDDIEAEADALYRWAGFDLGAPAPSVALAQRLLGTTAVRMIPALTLPGNGALIRVYDKWRIYLRRAASPRAQRFALLHELSHWALGPEATEEDCDALAAALLIPRRAFLRAFSQVGCRLTTLANEFAASESCIALRVGEATQQPVALVAPKAIRVRGAAWAWPSEPVLRSDQPIRGLRKARLRDDRRRSLIRAI